MKTLTLKIELLTPVLPASGTAYGSIIDTDIVFDEVGLPFIPAKRIKGCLRDSAMDVHDTFSLAEFSIFNESHINKTFGIPGDEVPGVVYFSNLTLKDYEAIKESLKRLYEKKEYNSILNREAVLSYFTEIRQQTSIDKETGVAKEHSLRVLRVLKKGLVFEGRIDLMEKDVFIEKVLYFSAKNLRHLGTRRTRGFGFIRCFLYEGDREINFLNELEEVCRK